MYQRGGSPAGRSIKKRAYHQPLPSATSPGSDGAAPLATSVDGLSAAHPAAPSNNTDINNSLPVFMNYLRYSPVAGRPEAQQDRLTGVILHTRQRVCKFFSQRQRINPVGCRNHNHHHPVASLFLP
jgi:hypothetical protein